MQTFAITSLGCKVNQYEAEQSRQYLEDRGLRRVRSPQKADLVVVHTCCVTHTASAKSRRALNRAANLNTDAVVVAAGCLPAGPPTEVARLHPSVLQLQPGKDVASVLAEIVARGRRSAEPALNASQPSRDELLAAGDTAFSATHHGREPSQINRHGANPATTSSLRSFSGHTRAFLKVQDGCDAHCTYCIIPKIRTKVCSKPLNRVVEEARHLVAAGHKEIVLTGVSLGAYGQDTVNRKHWDHHRPTLAELVEAVAQVDGLLRLRLSSLHPGDLTDELLDKLRIYKNLAPHLHLPLQSGSNEVLRRMGRRYTAGAFLQAVKRAEVALDRPAITTDIIVGFPGETDPNFEQTLELAEQLRFAKIHVFSFSKRAGTAAARMRPAVPAKIIKERSRRLQQLDERLQQRFRKRFAGEKLEVLIESQCPAKGRCERYFMVELAGPKFFSNGQFVSATLQKNLSTADAQ